MQCLLDTDAGYSSMAASQAGMRASFRQQVKRQINDAGVGMYTAIITGALVAIRVIVVTAPILGGIVHVSLHSRGTDITDDPCLVVDSNAIGRVARGTATGIHPGLHTRAEYI